MFNTVMEYFKLGFNITQENWTLGLYKFLITFAVLFICFLLIALDVILLVEFFKNLDFEYFIMNLPELVELIDRTQLMIGVFLIIFDLIAFILLFLFYVAANTAIRASIKDYVDNKIKISFQQLISNFKIFFKRSVNLNIVIAFYYILVLFVVLLLWVGSIVPFFTIPQFAKDYWYFVILIVFADLFLLLIILLFNIYFSYWRRSAEFHMVILNAEWRDSLKEGRRIIKVEWRKILIFMLGFFFIGFIIFSIFGSIRSVLMVLPVIGIVFSLLLVVVQLAVRAYIKIFQNSTYIHLVRDQISEN